MSGSLLLNTLPIEGSTSYDPQKSKSDSIQIFLQRPKSDNISCKTIDIEAQYPERKCSGTLYPPGAKRRSSISIEHYDLSVKSREQYDTAQTESTRDPQLNNDTYKKLLEKERDRNRSLTSTIRQLQHRMRVQAQQKELADLRLQKCLIESSNQSDSEESLNSEYKTTPHLMLSTTRDDLSSDLDLSQIDAKENFSKENNDAEDTSKPQNTCVTVNKESIDPGRDETYKSFFLDNISDVSVASSATIPHIVPAKDERIRGSTKESPAFSHRKDSYSKLVQSDDSNHTTDSTRKGDTNLRKQRTKSLMTRKSSIRLSSMQLDFSKKAHRKSAVIGEHLVEVDTKSLTDTQEILNAAHRQSMVSMQNLKKFLGEADDDTISAANEPENERRISFNVVPISKPNKYGTITRAQPALTAPTVSCRVRRSFNTPLGGLREDGDSYSSKISGSRETFLDDLEEDTSNSKEKEGGSTREYSYFHQRNYMRKKKKPVMLGRASVTAYRN